MEGRGEIPYEEGRFVRNWAGTFEAHTERFYHPKTEEEVVKVRCAFYGLNGEYELMVDRQSCPTTWKGVTDGGISTFAVRHTFDIGMDDVDRQSE